MFDISHKGRTEEARDSKEGPNWFAVYTASHHEKHIAGQLAQRQVETFLPLYSEPRHWSKRKPVDLSLALFPNYLFVHIARGQRTAVLSTPGVFSIVGSAQGAWALPEHEIETIRNGMKERTFRPHAYVTVGERARVKSGVLAGLEGVILFEKQNLRMVLNLDQIMRSVAIEVDAEELEPISAEENPSAALASTVCRSA